MSDIVMPRLSDSMEEGTILRWLKQVGDDVSVGEELVEIETDKANMVYESDAAGKISELVADEGDTLPIGSVIARVGDGDGAAPASKPEDAEAPKETEEPAGEAEQAGEPAKEEKQPPPDEPTEEPRAPQPAGEDGHIKASPIAKRLARERGVDLAGLSGSGPGGRIVKVDVERAQPGASGAPTAPASTPSGGRDVETAKGSVEVVELNKLQQTIARRMAESKATAPHFYLTTEIDMSRAVAARQKLKEQAGGEGAPSFNDMVVKACAISLRENPRANGAYRDGRLELYSRVNVGVAVAAHEALVVPTVFDADRKGLRQIATEVRDLATKVREGTITPPELSGGTFTVSNLGMYGVDSFSAVINPPQAGILAVGAIVEKPVVRDGQVTTAHLMSVTLACDHRILYGAEGAEFLARIRQLLEEPVGLAL
jgi:pyruvate dehydrogenase E2 component (dihydrolipoamide acetyltransferase)